MLLLAAPGLNELGQYRVGSLVGTGLRGLVLVMKAEIAEKGGLHK